MNDEHTAAIQRLLDAGGPDAVALTGLLVEYSDYKGRAHAADNALDALMAENKGLRAMVDRLQTAIDQALDLGETEGMARGKMPYPDWWVVLDRALDARWEEKTM